ncbi:hypothetical protein DPMN_084231 [Dreissena polymorpha]|uniref:Uncharacterized protein n=1 Tax=Dreissena polymorpha TaxID=45954 RepID=A0A9D3YAP1_DREPO|nr:hypothetical protein DPMN_084231 [Dreissena polymorpha]
MGIKLKMKNVMERCCPCISNSSGEKIGFAKYKQFSGEGSVELDELNAPNENGVAMDNRCFQRTNSTVVVREKENKITEWQAGWNVTNAIQVKRSITFN